MMSQIPTQGDRGAGWFFAEKCISLQRNAAVSRKLTIRFEKGHSIKVLSCGDLQVPYASHVICLQWLLFFLLVLLNKSVFSEVIVDVSSEYSAVHYANTVRLKPGEVTSVKLYDTPFQDRYVISVNVASGTVKLIVVDERDIITNNPSPRILLTRVVKNSANVEIPPLPSKEGATVSILNTHRRNPIDLRITLFRVGHRPPEVVQSVKEWLEIPIKGFDLGYVLPTFKVGCLNRP